MKTIADYGKKIQEVTGAINTCKNTIQKLGEQGKAIENAINTIKNEFKNCQDDLQNK